MNIKGKKSVDSIHKELGRVMWEYVGMGRTSEGLNVELDKAFRLNDFITMGELIAYGEVSTFAGSLFGIDYTYRYKLKKTFNNGQNNA